MSKVTYEELEIRIKEYISELIASGWSVFDEFDNPETLSIWNETGWTIEEYRNEAKRRITLWQKIYSRYFSITHPEWRSKLEHWVFKLRMKRKWGVDIDNMKL